ncbi:MAG: alkaline phosphatase family protein [Desulfonauticus sp.]|nr:alkaline phosphatase family protein [Desulfonauticus sp.]
MQRNCIPRKNRLKTLVIGLDGLSYSLACSLAEAGVLRSLRPFLDSNKAKAITSEIPYLSPVNWTSFYTATGPEKHGVFGFTEFCFKQKEIFFSDFSKVQKEPLFGPNRAQNTYFKIINLPHTYPAGPISGQLISGFLSLDLKKAIYPPPLYSILHAKGYVLEANTIKAFANPKAIFSELRKTLLARRLAFDLLWPDLIWDVFIFVLTEPDRLFHFCFDALMEPKHPLHQKTVNLIQDLDKLVTRVLECFRKLPEPKRLIFLADHGFTKLHIEVDLNAYFRQIGILQQKYLFTDPDLRGLTPKTQAFALDAGKIYLYPFCPEAKKLAKQKLGEKIKQWLLALRYKQKQVIARVFWHYELYPEAKFSHVPDLICVPNPGFDLKGKFDRKNVFEKYTRTGAHLEKDVLFFDSFGSQVKRVRDVGKLIEEVL